MRIRLRAAMKLMILAGAIPQMAFAQGSLTPTSGPSPLFRTLQEVEPRTPILSYGASLTRAGSYYFVSNLVSASSNQNGITIGTSNVTIDLNGFSLLNTHGGSNTADGISFSGVDNVTVRNGTISGFDKGVDGSGVSHGIVLERLRISDCRMRGISLFLSDGSEGAIVRDCLVFNIGGVRADPNVEVRGIEVRYTSARIEDNTVFNVVFNGVINSTADGGYGIYCVLSFDTWVVNNQVGNCTYGIRMNGPNEYRDNMTSSILSNSYVAGTDRGNNF